MITMYPDESTHPTPTARLSQRQVSFRDVDRALTLWLRKHDPAYLRNSNTRRARGDCRELPEETAVAPATATSRKSDTA